MADLEKYKEKLAALTSLIGKMEQGTITLEELSEMEQLTRSLHERSIILRYKAFEKEAGVETNTEPTAEAEPQSVITPEPEIEPIVEDDSEEPAIDFAIFDEPEDEIEQETFPEPESSEEPEAIEEPEVEEHLSVSKSEEETEEGIETTIEVTHTKEVSGFLDKLNIEDNSIASQFSGRKLDSLVGAFGLNEKLRFINNLFDGSSETFADAIKVLDNQDSLESAQTKAAEMAGQHDWDPEEENVIEFMTFVRRRYA